MIKNKKQYLDNQQISVYLGFLGRRLKGNKVKWDENIK